MTYGELSYRAKKLYTKGEITICEYLEMTKPLDREIEQEPYDIETYCKEHFCVMVDKDVWEKAEKALKQEKIGHWVDTDEGFSPCECSECKSVEFIKSKFCPNCGARMEGET